MARKLVQMYFTRCGTNNEEDDECERDRTSSDQGPSAWWAIIVVVDGIRMVMRKGRHT